MCRYETLTSLNIDHKGQTYTMAINNSTGHTLAQIEG